MRIPILMYHAVCEEADGAFAPFAVRPGDFRCQMEHLAQAGVATLTVSALLARLAAGSPPDEPTVVITFDDAFDDFTRNALPVLQALGLPATQYVVSGLVGGTSRWLDDIGQGHRSLMDGPALREAAAAGIEIGAHSHTHARLDALPPDELEVEVAGSKSLIEDVIGGPVTTFAYPYGLHGAAARAAVRRAGFAGACAVGYRCSTPGDDRFAVPRHIVRRDMPLPDFVRTVSGADYAPRMLLDRTRSWAWRTLRAIAP